VESRLELKEILFADSWNEELGSSRGRTRASTSWIAQHPDCARRIVVPLELKWEVRDKLDQANLTERVLFPSLDGLFRWLARYYAPRKVAQRESRHRSGTDT